MNSNTVRAKVEGGDLYCEVSGEGSPLLLLHGLAVDGRMFESVVPGLIRHHRIIVPDLRGHGRGARLPGPYTVDQMVKDLGTLLETVGVPSTVVLGYSAGGPVAQALARAHPSKVQGLVLACTYAHNPLSLRERLEAHLIPTLLRTVGPPAMGALIVAFPRAGGGTPMDRTSGLRLKYMMACNDRKTMAAVARDAMAFDSRPWLREIRCPTLVIAGAEDRAVPRPHALMLVRGIPGAELRLVGGAGHALAWTHTGDLVGLVEEWCDR